MTNLTPSADGLITGRSLSQEIVVEDGDAIAFLGEGARVLGTPWMILWMERTARSAIQPYLPEGWDSVGTAVSVRHLAPAPLGATVTFHAESMETFRRRVRFKVRATMGEVVIGEGTHERALILVERFATRLAGGAYHHADPQSQR